MTRFCQSFNILTVYSNKVLRVYFIFGKTFKPTKSTEFCIDKYTAMFNRRKCVHLTKNILFNFWRDSETQFMWLQHKPYCVRILNHPWSLLLVCLIPENVFKMVVGDVGKITSHWHMDILNSLVSWSIKILYSSNASDIYHLVSCHQIR